MQEKESVRKDLYGDEYIEARDEYGHVVQISYPKHSSYLGDYYETYDANRNYIGYSRPKTDSSGQRVIETYDRSNNLLFTSYEHNGMYGKVYWTIVDAHGRTIGTKTGNTTNYTPGYDKEREQEENASSAIGNNSSSSSDAEKKSAPVGGGVSMVGTLAIMFFGGVLVVMLHNAEGREQIHHFVIPMIGIIPIGILLFRFFRKLKDIVDQFKWKALILSIVLMLVMLGYYIWYTSKSMAWVIDNDLAYYSLWLLPYCFLFIYSFVLGKMSMQAKQMMNKQNLDKILEVIFPTTLYCFCFCPALMVMRWEYYSESVKHLRLIVEFFTLIVVGAVGFGAALLAVKVFDLATKSSFEK